MKKLFTFVAIAALAVACCSKPAVVTVEKFFENPKAFVGQDTTISGVVKAAAEGQFILGVADSASKWNIVVIPATEDIKVCQGCVGKEVNVKGLISEIIIDNEFIINLENEANADADSTVKANKLQKAVEYREVLTTDGVFSVYTISATAVTAKDCCKKEGKCEKEGCKEGEDKACCKGDSTKCEKPAEVAAE